MSVHLTYPLLAFCSYLIFFYILFRFLFFKFIFRSFNDKPVNEKASGPIGKELFEREQDDLLSDLKDIPKKACDRRVRLSLTAIGPFPISLSKILSRFLSLQFFFSDSSDK